jgi:hypothetical protein
MTDGGTERRAPRFATRLPTQWRWSLVAGDVSVSNMSRGGLFLRSRETVKAGSFLQLEVKLPDGPVDLFVVVRYRTELGMGVAIHTVSADHQQRWLAHCEALETRPRSSA